jgi:hypothetical protein
MEPKEADKNPLYFDDEHRKCYREWKMKLMDEKVFVRKETAI